MNEPLFRGKSIELGTWVYGYYVLARGRPFILPKGDSCGYDETSGNNGWIEVFSGSVGQHIGRKDENGKDIYAGDIITHKFWNMLARKSRTDARDIVYILVEWSNNQWCGKIFGLDGRHILSDHWFEEKDCCIIGNIFDSPGILQEVGSSQGGKLSAARDR